MRRAGERAEREWYAKQKSPSAVVVVVGGGGGEGINGGASDTRVKWMQAFVDRVVDTFVTC